MFDKVEIPISDCDPNVVPAGCIEFSCTDDGVTIKGFKDPKTGDIHIQECLDGNKP